MARIAIFTDEPGWHGARLRQAFVDQGYACEYVSLTECRLTTESSVLPVLIPGFEQTLPDAVFVRGVPGGSLEEVVFYLDILHALQALNIPVYNDGRAVERSVDKGMTSFLLRAAGLPTPLRCRSTRSVASNAAMSIRQTLCSPFHAGIQMFSSLQFYAIITNSIAGVIGNGRLSRSMRDCCANSPIPTSRENMESNSMN